MKRSLINQKIDEAIKFMKEKNFLLPPFAYWSIDKWKNLNSEYCEIIDNKLGWDVTDFGSGDFENKGLLLFTLRNGNLDDENNIKTYAEKVLIVEKNQVTPLHYHWHKTEDIINRGGGNLIIKLFLADDNDKLSNDSFYVSKDGRKIKCMAGEKVKLEPGESITLYPKLYHSFWAEENKVLVGEVSETNNDDSDNRFYDELPRFSKIDEDIDKKYLLVNEY